MTGILINKGIHYFAVYYSKYDTELDFDLLLNLRRNFFENGKKQKNKVTKESLGSLYKYSYSLEANHYMKWKKLEDSKLVEKSQPESNGNYNIVTYNNNAIIKISYYNNNHSWIKTEYFCTSYKKIPCVVIAAKENTQNLILSLYNKDNQSYITREIFPFVEYAEQDELSAICASLNIPSVKCITSAGSFYYFDKNEMQKAENILNKIRQGQKLLNDVANLTNKNKTNDKSEEFDKIKKEDEPLCEKSECNYDLNAKEENNKIDLQLKDESETKKFKDSNNKLICSKSEDKKPIKTEKNLLQGSEKDKEDNNCIICEKADKIIPINEYCSYYYYGQMLDEKRNGRGRTCMPDGKTAYEGDYLNDKRDGFGVYYYKTGKLCYIGGWKENKRHGFGVSFSGNGNSVYIGSWINDEPNKTVYEFDTDENLVFLNSSKSHFNRKASVRFDNEVKNLFIRKFENGEPTNKGTQFDEDGTLLYMGEFKNGKKEGYGTKYNKDGEIIYKGEFKDDEYNGKGELHFNNGNTVKGEFSNGKLLGLGCEYNSNGFKIYEGEFEDNLYNNDGCKFFENGNSLKGKFLNGEPYGILSCFDRNKNLKYKGQLKDYKFNGEGILYVNNKKVYEGHFCDNCYSGFGTRYKNDTIEYTGIWQSNKYNGSGILYENGKIKYVGLFKDGKKHGRINKITDDKVNCECIYEEDELIYAKEYDVLTGNLVYCGNIKNGKRNGMGALFTAYGEKTWEGIFNDDKPQIQMNVKLRNLEPLKECEELINTKYENFIYGNNFVIDYNIGMATYTGFLNDNKPDKRGTMLYEDHKYIGEIDDGDCCGKGIVYKNDGSKLEGEFLKSKVEKSKLIECANGIKYFML